MPRKQQKPNTQHNKYLSYFHARLGSARSRKGTRRAKGGGKGRDGKGRLEMPLSNNGVLQLREPCCWSCGALQRDPLHGLTIGGVWGRVPEEMFDGAVSIQPPGASRPSH